MFEMMMIIAHACVDFENIIRIVVVVELNVNHILLWLCEISQRNEMKTSAMVEFKIEEI